MQIHWFQNEDHLVYINGATQLADLERTLHFPGLEEAANALRRHPTPEGLTIKGPKRSTSRWERISSSIWVKCRSAM